MHRTQILLDEKQYVTLRQHAKQNNRSISSIIRELLDQYMPASPVTSSSETPLSQLSGMIDGNGETRGQDHNKILYHHYDMKKSV